MSSRRFIQFPNHRDLAPGFEIEVIFEGSQKKTHIQMMLDTGSSRTTIPLELLENDLEACSNDFMPCRDFNDGTYELPIFTVNLIIESNTFKDIDVLGSQNPHYGLLGRDILTRHILRCDGPAQRFELEYQP